MDNFPLLFTILSKWKEESVIKVIEWKCNFQALLHSTNDMEGKKRRKTGIPGNQS